MTSSKAKIHAVMLKKAVEIILSFRIHICPTQPRKLRKIAWKMNKVMRKFSINGKSPSDRDVSERQNSIHSGMCNYLPSDTADMHIVRLQFQADHRSSQKQPFTPAEDEELMKGLKKHGWTNWTNILRDKTLTFSKGRTAKH